MSAQISPGQALRVNCYMTGALVALLFAVIIISVSAQQSLREGRFNPGGRLRTVDLHADQNQFSGEFTFVRAIYNSPSRGWRGGSWMVDFPEADEHFITGIREWVGTNLSVSGRPHQLGLLDDRIFDFPLMYFVEPGTMELSADESAKLREYLTRGGFIFLDDFHGEYEFQHVEQQLKQVFPEYQLKELPLTHPIFHSYLDIDSVLQVPGVAALSRGVTYEKGGVQPYYMGIEDKEGRLMVFVTRNCDLGDAWEWINDSRYPVNYGITAYRIGINVIIYAMTH